MSDKTLENELLEIIYAYRKAQLLYVAAKLDISSILANGPKSSDEIAKNTNTNPDALYRVLRALSSFGIYKENKDKYFELTDKGAFLQNNVNSSVRINAIMRMEEYNWRPWGELLYSVKTGNSSFEKIFGMNLFEYLANNPEASQTFVEGMRMGANTQVYIESVLKNYDFSCYQMIADIGGSNGVLLNKILAKYPHTQGILFDLPNVIQIVNLDLFKPEIKGRLRFSEGSFFDSIPNGCDLYIFMRILHDWDDSHSISILKNCYNACAKNAKILLIENIINSQNEHSSGVLINDIHMLVQTIGGRERTQDEYCRLLSEAGFTPISFHEKYIEGIKK